jgi:hypothetical protein
MFPIFLPDGMLVLLRELLIVFAGNELSIGPILAA